MDYIPVPVLAVVVVAAVAVAVAHIQDMHQAPAQSMQCGASGIERSVPVSGAAAVGRTRPIHRVGDLHRDQGPLLEWGCRGACCALENQGGIEVGVVAGKVQIDRILGVDIKGGSRRGRVGY
jgi:hypothetical protein